MTPFRSALAAGTPQLGLSIMYPSPGVIERIGAEWDWVWIDMQHGQIDREGALAMVRACDLVRRPAFVRVPGHEAGPIGVVLDTGAAGVVVPCVDTPEQARAVVAAAKFPPLGNRSYGGRRAVDLHGREYSDTANDEVMLIVQIESPQAVENADAIAAVQGVDALFLGPDDIMLRRGYAMNTPRSDATLGADMRAVTEACRKHGKHSVMVGVGAEMLRLCVAMRFDMIVSGSDVLFLASGSRDTSAEARAILKQHDDRGDAKPATRAGQVPGSPY